MQERLLTGIHYLEAATTLLRRVRAAHPTAGTLEAADLQWWWRTPRSTDDLPQLFCIKVCFRPGDEASRTSVSGSCPTSRRRCSSSEVRRRRDGLRADGPGRRGRPARARLAAAIAAGGRVVDASNAPRWWTLSDRAGNRVCVCGWPDGSGIGE